jgi:integrase
MTIHGYNRPWFQEEALRSFVGTLRNRAEAALSQRSRSPVQAHNALVHYTVAMLQFATGHRPVVDPFCYLSEFDLDNRQCLINDKVVSQRHQFRVSCLPEAAVRQMAGYLRHLEWLSHRLRQASDAGQRALGEALAQILDGTERPKVPLFFLLNRLGPPVLSIGPSSLETEWSSILPLPTNWARSALATILTSEGLPASSAQAMLNHLDGVRHPFGPRALAAPLQLHEALSPAIDGFLNRLGWYPVTPPGRPGGKRRKPGKSRWAGRLHASDAFGPVRRARERADRRKQVRQLVVGCFGEVFPDGLPPRIRESDVDAIEERVECASQAAGLNTGACLWQARARLRAAARSGIVVEGLRRTALLRREASPISKDAFQLHRASEYAMAGFVHALDQRGRESEGANLAERLAALVVSAALFGGLVRYDRLEGLPLKAVAETCSEEGQVFVEFDHYRWFPDRFSKALLVGLRQTLADGGEDVDIDMGALRTLLSTLLRDLGLSPGRRNPFSVLAEVGGSRLIFRLPGFLRSAATGERPSRSVPAAAYARLIRGQRVDLQPQVDESSAAEGEDAEWIPEIHPDVYGDQARARQIYLDLRGIVADAKKKSARGRKRVKPELATAIANYTQAQAPLPSVAAVICGWLWRLCHHGPRKADIAITTIDRYFGEVVEPLLTLGIDVDWINLSAPGHEEIYLRALEFGRPKDRRYQLDRLVEFHRFAVSQLAVENPDWSVHYAVCGAKCPDASIDANIVTPAEYRRALDLIQADESLSPGLRDRYSLMLIIGFRFGLRFGEAWRIQWRDVQRDEDTGEIWLQVSNSVFGEVKTLAGVRQVPLVGQLDPVETGVMNRVLGESVPLFEEDPRAGLMVEGGPRMLIDRWRVSDYLNRLLRHVTGDTDVRYHHLRHTWASRMIALAFPEPSDKDWTHVRRLVLGGLEEADRETLLGPYARQANPLVAIADAMGHANELTTVSSYFHFHDLLTCASLNDGLPSVSAFALSWALGVPHNTITQRQTRAKPKTERLDAAIEPQKPHRFIPSLPMGTESLDGIPPWAGARSVSRRVDIGVIDRVLTLLSRRGGDIGAVAEIVSLDESRIRELVAAAADIERQSGYEGYRAALACQQRLLGSAHEVMPPHARNRQEDRRLRKLARDIATRFDWTDAEAMAGLERGLAAWARAHHGRPGRWIFTSVDDIDAFLKLLDGLRCGRWGLEAHQLGNKCLPSEARAFFGAKDIALVEVKRLPSPREKTGPRRRYRILLKPTIVPEDVGTAGALNRVLFCLAVSRHAGPEVFRSVSTSATPGPQS